MFMYSAFGDMTLAPQEVMKLKMLKLAEKYGWTLDYIRSMGMSEFHEVSQMVSGETQAMNYVRRNPKAFGLGD